MLHSKQESEHFQHIERRSELLKGIINITKSKKYCTNDNVGEVMLVNVTVATGGIMNDSLTSHHTFFIKQAYVHLLSLSIQYDIPHT